MRQSKVTIALIGFIACCLISKSCANTTTAPSGGPKDTLAPVLIKLTPDNNSTNFPVYGGQIAIQYDEYTIIKNATDIYLSPPHKKRPVAKIKGKNIIVTFPDTLRSNTTYSLDFGQSLADNNEGNPANRLVYSFSTGDVVDSLYCTGKVIDCKTLKPVKNILVAFFSDMSDSACFNTYPDMAVKSDEWGFFAMRNLKPIPYKVYAYTDGDSDSKYSPAGDQIAFLDSTYTPSKVIRDSIYELGYFLMKDTLLCQKRVADFTLSLFTELQASQSLQNSGRINEKMGFLKFSAPDVKINSMEIFGVDSSALIVQYNQARDSLNFWINTQYKLEDSLLVKINYLKTDSLGNLSPFTEDIAMGLPEALVAAIKKKETDKTKQDTAFSLKLAAASETVEQDGISLTFDTPIVASTPDSIKLTSTNPKNQTSEMKYSIRQDSTEIRRMILRPEGKLQVGYNYELTVPHGTFTNLNFLPNNEEKVKFAIPNSEQLSSLTLHLTDVSSRYIVELVNEKMDKVFRTYYAEQDTSLVFPYLKADRYSIRITEDLNKNNIFDTGNLLLRRQPEKVLMYKLEEDNQVIEIPESTDLEQTINIKEMFK